MRLLILSLISWCVLANAQVEQEILPLHQFNIVDQQYYDMLVDADYDASKLKGTGYMPFLRAKRFYLERLMANGDHASKNNWKALLKSNERYLSSRGSHLTANWQTLGPNKLVVFGGRMISHAFDPVDINTVYAGSATGGLWKTTDGGQFWRSMTDDIPSTGVGGVAVNPKNAKNVVIGTGEGYFLGITLRPGLGIFISYDAGETWEETSFNFQQSQQVSVLKMSWDPIDTNNVYAAATNGIWASRDGGKTWFVKMAGIICDDIVVNPVENNIVYSTIENDGIYKSTDYGNTWSRLNNGLPVPGIINFARISLCNAQPNTLYASLTDLSTLGLEGLYRTDDAGVSWRKIPQAPNAFCPPPPFTYGCQGHYDNTVCVSPYDPELVLLGGITFWRSANGGQTWSQHDVYTSGGVLPPPGKTFVDHHDAGFSPHDERLVYSFNDGGVAISKNAGGFWVPSNEGIYNSQFYAIASAKTNTEVVIGGFQDHGLQATDLKKFSDKQWIKWGFLDGSGVVVDHTDHNTFYGVWIDGQYLKTTNGTGAFQTIFINGGIDRTENNGSFFNPIAMHPVDPKILMTATSRRIYRTKNGGLWSPIANIPDVSHIAFDQLNPDIVYAAAYSIANGTWAFWISENGGNDWRSTANSPGWRITDLVSDPNTSGRLWATRNSAFAGNPHVLRSDDFGESWVSVQGDLPDITVNSLAVNGYNTDQLFAATDLGVYATTDGGIKWFPYNDGMPISICYDIHFHSVDTTLRVGTIGRAAWRTKIGREMISGIKDDIAEESVLLYPNPSSSDTNLSFYLRKSSNVRIQVLNLYGQLLGEKIMGQLRQGQNTIENVLSCIGLKPNSGTYFIRLKLDNMAITRKLQVAK